MAYRHVVKRPQLQARIFLCNWYVKIVRPGREIPDNTVQFHVPMDMSKLDVRNYLQSIYNVDVYKVNTRIQHGKTKSIVKNDKLVKKKLPDYKASGTFKFPDLFSKEEPKDDKSSKTDDMPQKSVPFRWF
ncbi:large ribosomal subunit protein uL23m-like isoform X2 [Montipora capricornis]|uniref:large ribosomal subunit protein uL23m-like isoform X2 n=1 Tax=Montipora foliosa TaxID=591990 RepID=UPI0035F21444